MWPTAWRSAAISWTAVKAFVALSRRLQYLSVARQPSLRCLRVMAYRHAESVARQARDQKHASCTNGRSVLLIKRCDFLRWRQEPRNRHIRRPPAVESSLAARARAPGSPSCAVVADRTWTPQPYEPRTPNL